jgi:threonyl-tRNA synthetase
MAGGTGGVPMKKLLGLLVLAVFVFVAFRVGDDTPKNSPKPTPELTPEQHAEKAAKEAEKAAKEAQFQRDVLAVRQLRANMKNPESFKLEEALRMSDGTLCLTYRATNSFNAIVPGQAVISKTRITTSDTRERLVSAWNKLCANKSGSNITYIRQALF